MGESEESAGKWEEKAREEEEGEEYTGRSRGRIGEE